MNDSKVEIKSKSTPTKKENYNEKKVFQQFLNSKDGISFLTEKRNEEKISNFTRTKKKRMPYEKIIDELIDFYLTWAENIPIRRNNLCAYELFKLIEKNCDSKEVKELFSYLIKDD